MSAGYWHNLVLLADGRVWGWGNNDHGQLGNPGLGNQVTPVAIADPVSRGELSGIIAVSAGGEGKHSVALKSDGTVLTWGQGGSQLGRGLAVDHNALPTLVTDLDQVTAISAGGWHTLALRADGTLWSWGANAYGQLADGTIYNAVTPSTRRKVITLRHRGGTVASVVAMAAGDYHSVVALEDGTVWSWGLNEHGQLGNNDQSLVPSGTPVQVPFPAGIDAPAIAVAGCYQQASSCWQITRCGLGATTGYSCIGNKIKTVGNVLTPVRVSVPAAVAIAAGKYEGAALLEDGTVKTWGANDYNGLGYGTGSSNGVYVCHPVTVVTKDWTATSPTGPPHQHKRRSRRARTI